MPLGNTDLFPHMYPREQRVNLVSCSCCKVNTRMQVCQVYSMLTSGNWWWGNWLGCAVCCLNYGMHSAGFKCRLGAVVEYYMSELVLLLNLCLCTFILLPMYGSVVGRNELYCFHENRTRLVSSFCFVLPVLFQSFGVYVLFFPLSLADG